MKVLFGNTPAVITRVESNLLECTVPARLDLAYDTPVRVVVANLHPQYGVLWAQEVLPYTYRVGTQAPYHSHSAPQPPIQVVLESGNNFPQNLPMQLKALKPHPPANLHSLSGPVTYSFEEYQVGGKRRHKER